MAVPLREPNKDHREAARNHEPKPQWEHVKFTEMDPWLVMLYEDARAGQFTLSTLEWLRKNRPAYLYWLAGHTRRPEDIDLETDPEAKEKLLGEWQKLRANGQRARDLVDRAAHDKRNRALIITNVCVAIIAAATVVSVAYFGKGF